MSFFELDQLLWACFWLAVAIGLAWFFGWVLYLEWKEWRIDRAETLAYFWKLMHEAHTEGWPLLLRDGTDLRRLPCPVCGPKWEKARQEASGFHPDPRLWRPRRFK